MLCVDHQKKHTYIQSKLKSVSHLHFLELTIIFYILHLNSSVFKTMEYLHKSTTIIKKINNSIKLFDLFSS